MQDVIAALLGAGLVSSGYILKFIMDRVSLPKQQNKEPTQFTNMSFAGELFCGHIETVSEEDDPWAYLLEPCDNAAFVIMGGITLCEKHRDDYLLDMSKHR